MRMMSEQSLPRAHEGERVRVGPFSMSDTSFAIESNEHAMAAELDSRLRDLRVDHADGWPTVFTVDRNGPPWASHPWGVWRDGGACETSLAPAAVLPFLLWEITRLLIENVATDVPVHGSAVTLDGKSVLLVGGGVRAARLAAALVASGWGYQSHDVTVLRNGDDQVLVRPFWRPIEVHRGEGLDHVLGTSEESTTLPVSTLGTLAPPTPLAVVVLATFSRGHAHDTQPLSPAETLAGMCEELPLRGAQGRRSFTALAPVAESVPGYSLRFDDVAEAEGRLRDLMRSLP